MTSIVSEVKDARQRRGIMGRSVMVYCKNFCLRALVILILSVGNLAVASSAAKLSKPRAAWIMVPAGDPTEQTVNALAQRFQAGDVIIDGGNSYYKDDVRRSQKLAMRWRNCDPRPRLWRCSCRRGQGSCKRRRRCSRQRSRCSKSR